MHNPPTALHNSSAQYPTPPPPYQPPSQQTHRGTQTTQTTPTSPPPQNSPLIPSLTLLEKLEKLDTNLKVYAPVILSILDTVAPSLIIGSLMLVIMGWLMVRIVRAVVEVWWG
ncbi:hypothetical protein VC83_09292 [Pseudogymnoascus destructans]|uniref:Uncharacterized protein n=1 Tax=Pseudogymnoascus destructans TaxID=655981 RepID=A0A176ZWX4_9PEZI|nr:uncharacterized protein VC83_09292 [Pseudogymnoascus destructans]OAF54426.1 hypothetical protein VC83_09292 [Pseudogymnoascus destructans]